jgi:phospholipid/cholesterol/gamma-HCH transport system substrate-binding protein
VIRRSVWVKTGVFVVIAVLGVSYVLVRYIGVADSLLGRGYTAYVDLADSGGVFPSASVTYRGVEVGRVGSIQLHGDGIRVALDINSSHDIPADTRAVVGNGSPIGEQFIDLRPESNNGPYLHDGSVIPQSRTALPVSTQDLLVSLDRLVNSVPKDDLHTVVTELGETFANAGPDLRRLLDSSHALLASATDNLPQTIQLLNDGGVVLDTQRDLSSDIVSFSQNLARFTDALRSSDADLRKVLDGGVAASQQLVALDHSIDATLPIVLGNLTSLGQVVSVRIPALRQILIIYPYVVSTSFGLFPGNESTRFGFPVPPTEDHQPCKKGYLNPDKRRLPSELKYPPMRWNSFCKESTHADVGVRGSRMAPQPGGGRLGDDPDYYDGEAQAGGGHHRQASTAPTALGTVTPSFTAPDGRDYVVASTGGQQRVLGDRSWMWLLFGPMS